MSLWFTLVTYCWKSWMHTKMWQSCCSSHLSHHFQTKWQDPLTALWIIWSWKFLSSCMCEPCCSVLVGIQNILLGSKSFKIVKLWKHNGEFISKEPSCLNNKCTCTCLSTLGLKMRCGQAHYLLPVVQRDKKVSVWCSWKKQKPVLELMVQHLSVSSGNSNPHDSCTAVIYRKWEITC